MRRTVLTLLAAAAVVAGCSASPTAPSADPAAFLFPDVVFGDVEDFEGSGQVITEVVAPEDVFIVGRGDGAPIVLWRKDPNNGCRLMLVADHAGESPLDPSAAFFDACHGHQYAIDGASLTDRGTRSMNTVPTEVRDGELIWRRSATRDEVRAAAGQPG